LPVSESDNIRLMSLESGHLRRNPVSQIPATNLTGSGQKGRIPAIWPESRISAGPGQNGRLAGRIWPDPASLPGSGQMAGIWPLSPESGYPRF